MLIANGGTVDVVPYFCTATGTVKRVDVISLLPGVTEIDTVAVAVNAQSV